MSGPLSPLGVCPETVVCAETRSPATLANDKETRLISVDLWPIPHPLLLLGGGGDKILIMQDN